MAAPGSLDWLFAVIGWTLAGWGGLLLLWAVFWDRSRGRRRCPRCWYDMGGIPGLKCPECGREARSERRLFRTRRRWRRGVLAAAGVLAGLVVQAIPAYRSGGWVAALPSWVLMYAAPAAKPPARSGVTAVMTSSVVVNAPVRMGTLTTLNPKVSAAPAGSVTVGPGGLLSVTGGAGITNNGQGDVVVTPGASYTIAGSTSVTVKAGTAATINGRTGTVTVGAWPPPKTLPERLHQEMWSRLDAGRVPAWEARVYFRRLIDAKLEPKPEDLVQFPARWMADDDLPMRLARPVNDFTVQIKLPGGDWMSARDWGVRTAGGDIRNSVRFHREPGAAQHVPVAIRYVKADVTLYEQTIPDAVDFVEPIGELLDRLDTPEAGSRLAAAIRPRVVLKGGKPVMLFHDRSTGDEWKGIDYGVYFTVQLRLGARLVADGEGHVEWLRPVGLTDEHIALDWVGKRPSGEELDAGSLELVITGDRDAATRFYLVRPFEIAHPAAWTGTIRVPVEKLEPLAPAAPGKDAGP